MCLKTRLIIIIRTRTRTGTRTRTRRTRTRRTRIRTRRTRIRTRRTRIRTRTRRRRGGENNKIIFQIYIFPMDILKCALEVSTRSTVKSHIDCLWPTVANIHLDLEMFTPHNIGITTLYS